MKDKKDIIRVKNLLNSDRFNVCDDFLTLIENDLKRLLADYFDIKEDPIVQMVKEKDEYKICVSFTAYRVKSFGSGSDM